MPNGLVYPIIYVRGFAGGTSGIDTATDDPFYGFNDGATHVRVNGDGNPQFYQFEGPLVRLMEDEDYRVPVHGNQHAYLNQSAGGSQPRTSVWIYRFYDPDADTFGAAAVPYDLPTAARNLLAFVQLVLAKTDFTDPDGNPGDKKVWLVAHSMGGLICRSMIQKMCPDGGIAPGDLVDKLFTYATPHNGIDFGIFGLNIGVPQIAPFDAQIFNRKVMYQYLTPAAGLRQAPDMPDGWDAHVITGLDPSRVFCLIGTNATDYGAVSKAVGPKSDGLVQIDNAYVKGANRTFVHRSHSGRYGEVNSEEGYQNLRRFLFGTRKATVRLVNATLPAATSAGVLDVWQAEVAVSIRGLPVLMDDQTAAHYCPVELGKVAGASLPGGAPAPDDDAVTPGTGPAVSPGGPPLTTVFLLDPARARQQQRENLQPGAFSPRCRYSLQVKVIHLQEQHGLFTWQNHLEGAPEWADTLIVDIGPDDDDGTERVWAAWEVDISKVTSVPDPIVRDPLAPNPPGSLSFTIPLPSAGQQLLGAHAAIALNVELLSS
ncbi:MAG TPA: hypothetical protein VMK84_23450 [Streptosporangiaceae bacterium]|nr:hypothetical protein [Streptosporangiaceae bacterium]